MDENPTPGRDHASSAPEPPAASAPAAAPTSTEPSPQPASATRAPALGVRGTLLYLWRQLTSMQTALILLMLLAVAAVPGSLYPQRSVNPGLTEQYLEENGTWGEILDALGFFNVFTSPWFSAIYLLLFISLIGCIVPRIGAHASQLRAAPPRTPSRLTRFVGHTSTDVPGLDAEQALERARRALRRGRYRVAVHEERASRSVSAERGYLRETGNLLFHVGLVAVLICVAGGHLTQYRGQITVVEGEGFTNSLTRYDSYKPGAWFDSADMPPFRFTLDEFHAQYDEEVGSPNLGQPRGFQADITVQVPDEEEFSRTVEVNKPLSVPGADLFLLGNGYAPEITVTDPEGKVVAQGPVITIPRGDRGYTSQLVLKAPDARPEQMALVGFFLPTARIDEKGPHSVFPDTWDPEVVATVYTGNLGLDEGIPKSAYDVDISELEPMTDEAGSPALLRLKPGEAATLPDGSEISFDGIRRYAAFDIAHNPFEIWTLISALTATGGLILSLFVPRRRVWVRVTPTADGTRVDVAGLARSEDPGLEADVHALAERLATHDATTDDSTPTPQDEAARPASPTRPDTDGGQSS